LSYLQEFVQGAKLFADWAAYDWKDNEFTFSEPGLV
jgi:hypothetical protein